MERKVTIYSTVGKRSESIVCEGSTWKDLKEVMRDRQITYNGMKAVIGETRLVLESSNAVIPEEDFTLFLMPVKTKSGATERKELMDKIRGFRVFDPEGVKKHFTVDGKNVTQIKTEKLKELVASYKSPKSNSTKSVAVAKKKTTPSKENIKSKVEKKKDEIPSKEKGEEIVEHLEKMKGMSLIKSSFENVINFIKDLYRPVKKSEIDELAEMARDIASDFKDVKSF